MSFIHYVFLGHFERDGGVVRFAKTPTDDVYRPVVRRPLDLKAMMAVLQDVTGAAVDDLTFPDDWTAGMDNGYLVCDKYTGNKAEIDFIARLAERTRCDIYDAAGHGDIALPEWLAITREYAGP